MEMIVLGGGCFWCLEAAYQLVAGVEKIVPGYAGGFAVNPTYDDVCAQTTGHAEVVQITFDSKKITLTELLEIFWTIHNPTTKARQGSDIGTQYRSIILYKDDAQKVAIEKSIKNAQKLWSDPIITEVHKLETFYEAEAEHHNYFKNHPEQAYCQVIINPKLVKLRQKFKAKLNP